MKRLIFLLVSVGLTLTASARNDWYDKPLALPPDTLMLDTIPASPDGVMVHLRMAAPKKLSAQWSMILGTPGSEGSVQAKVSMPALSSHDDLYTPVVRVDVTTHSDSTEALITSTNFSTDDEFFSLKFVYDGFSARLFGGDEEKKLLAELPINLDSPTEVILASPSDLLARRISVMYNVGNTSSRGECPDVEKLGAQLADAKGIEGYWWYLDRDIDTKKASIGQKYRLAIVAAGNKTYQIVSLDPEAAKQGFTTPVQVKGWLRPTNFSNNYDMVWYDANGHELNDDNNAQLSDDGSILTLRFPIYKSQIRFARP